MQGLNWAEALVADAFGQLTKITGNWFLSCCDVVNSVSGLSLDFGHGLALDFGWQQVG